MSRHTIDSIAPEHTTVVGYDRPLDNFFATVYDPAAENDIAFWVPGVDSPEDLAAAIAPYATIPSYLMQTLAKERRERDTHPMNKVVDHRTMLGSQRIEIIDADTSAGMSWLNDPETAGKPNREVEGGPIQFN